MCDCTSAVCRLRAAYLSSTLNTMRCGCHRDTIAVPASSLDSRRSGLHLLASACGDRAIRDSCQAAVVAQRRDLQEDSSVQQQQNDSFVFEG